MIGLAPKWVRLAPNGTNPGIYQIRFQCIWAYWDAESKNLDAYEILDEGRPFGIQKS